MGAKESGGRILTTGHAVDGVVDDDGSQIEIAASRMNKVVATNGRGIAIAHNRHHLQARLGQLDAGGKGQGAAMGGMESVEVEIGGHAAGTADARGQHHLVLVQLHAVDGP